MLFGIGMPLSVVIVWIVLNYRKRRRLMELHHAERPHVRHDVLLKSRLHPCECACELRVDAAHPRPGVDRSPYGIPARRSPGSGRGPDARALGQRKPLPWNDHARQRNPVALRWVPLRLFFQAFVVLTGTLILSGAVNTSIIGSNGVLNRVSEDGVLSSWFRRPHHRFGTSYRIINLVALLQFQLFTHRDLWAWLNAPFTGPPVVEGPAQLLLEVA